MGWDKLNHIESDSNHIKGNVRRNTQREKLVLPEGHDHESVLLHICCAPCSAEIIESLADSEISFTIFFYNPNIHPSKEYETRKEESKNFACSRRIPFVDSDYDSDRWFKRTKGMEWEPERGKRCTICFDMRLEKTALFAKENGFRLFATSMGISRWKNMQQVNACGLRAALSYPGLTYWNINWRKKGGSQRMIEISKREHFYQQEYCGCIYSLRDNNIWRRSQGRKNIELGQKFYANDPPTEHTNVKKQ